MIRIRDLNMMLDTLREVKDFGDEAYIELKHDPRIGGPGQTGVKLTFSQGDVDVTMETDILRLTRGVLERRAEDGEL